MRVLGLASSAVLSATGCSSGPKTPTVGPAKSFQLVDFRPPERVEAGKPVQVSFRVRQQPSGKIMTRYKRGAGPHTGIHLILVRRDLTQIVHHHPPVAADGTLHDTVVFPLPGRYRVLADVYPASGRNFQVTTDVNVAGPFSGFRPIPPFMRTVVVDGYRVTLARRPRLRAIEAALVPVTVTRPDGTPARFEVWFGALAHAIFFRAGSLDCFHTHVCGPNTPGCTTGTGGARVSGRSARPGRLTVGILLPEAGRWRMFLQMKADDRVLTAPFTLEVR